MLTKLIDLVNQGSLTMGTNPAAVKNISEILIMTGRLSQEKSKFYGALRDAGITDATKAASLWSQYRNKYALVSADLKTNLPENLTKWQEFIPGAKKETPKENDSIAQTTGVPPKQLYSSALKRNVSQQDIQDTMKARKKSRQQVLDQWGIK